METFNTKYGKITLKSNEEYIISSFRVGKYYDDRTLKKLKLYIDCDKNILEIGGHSGTSTLAYSTFLNKGNIYVYEPQKEMYNLLIKNIEDNNLKNVYPFNMGVFCYNGKGNMCEYTLDGTNINEKLVNNDKILNYGGACIGGEGEDINLITLDDMDIDNIGFIHIDAQGCEPFIFSKALEKIKKFRPIIYYEKPERKFINNIIKSYPQYEKFKSFNIKKYCINNLNYRQVEINPGNNLLIPNK